MAQVSFDEKLLARIAEGDRAAFAEVYEATKSSVYGFALSVLRNRHDAEDVMHDAYLKLYQSAGSYRPQGKPMAFVLTIVRNLAYNRLRSAGRTGVGIEDSTVGAPSAPDQFGRVEDRMLLDTALSILDDTDRQIVILHAVTGMKHREIAEILGMNQSTVLSRYRRSLMKMRDEMDRKGVPL